MGYGSRNIVKLAEADYGLYLSLPFRNGFGTPLALRGSLDEVTHVNADVKFGGDAILTDSRTGDLLEVDPNTRRIIGRRTEEEIEAEREEYMRQFEERFRRPGFDDF